MKPSYTELLEFLKERFDNCYDNYMDELAELDVAQAVERSSEISAIKETYYEVRFWVEMSLCGKSTPQSSDIIKQPIAKQDVVTLLLLDNPLKQLGLKWWFHTFGNKADFYDFFKAQSEIQSKEGRCSYAQ